MATIISVEYAEVSDEYFVYSVTPRGAQRLDSIARAGDSDNSANAVGEAVASLIMSHEDERDDE